MVKKPNASKAKAGQKAPLLSLHLGNGLAIWISVIICQVSGTDIKHRTKCKKDKQLS